MWSRFLNRLFNTALFYIGWILCLKEAEGGQPFYGLLVVLAIILSHFYRTKSKKVDSLMFLSVLVIGPLSDLLYSKLGLLKYNSHQEISWLPPLWIFFLWGLFAININLFSWLKKRWFLATAFGAFGGPISYMSAIRLGGAQLLEPMPIALVVIGAIWAIFMPGFMWLNQFFKSKFD